jgi:hypothetical protein
MANMGAIDLIRYLLVWVLAGLALSYRFAALNRFPSPGASVGMGDIAELIHRIYVRLLLAIALAVLLYSPLGGFK